MKNTNAKYCNKMKFFFKCFNILKNKKEKKEDHILDESWLKPLTEVEVAILLKNFK